MRRSHLVCLDMEHHHATVVQESEYVRATRWHFALIWLEDVLCWLLDFRRQSFFLAIPRKNWGIEQTSEATSAKSASRCVSRGPPPHMVLFACFIILLLETVSEDTISKKRASLSRGLFALVLNPKRSF